jgi:hypothetical protein
MEAAADSEDVRALSLVFKAGILGPFDVATNELPLERSITSGPPV